MGTEEFKNVMVQITDFAFDLLAQEVRDRGGEGVVDGGSGSDGVALKGAVHTTTNARFPFGQFNFGRRA